MSSTKCSVVLSTNRWWSLVSTSLFLFLILTVESSWANQPTESAVHPNHQPATYPHHPSESIDVSSSIGVSSQDKAAIAAAIGGGPSSIGHVEDLLANESGEGDGPAKLLPPPMMHGNIGGPSMSHVVDSEHDLIQAESQNAPNHQHGKLINLSKLKHPFGGRVPGLDSLRFNNRFLNGAASFLSAGSNLAHQVLHPSHNHPQQQQQHGPPQGGPFRGGNGVRQPPFRPQFPQQGNGPNGPNGPVFKHPGGPKMIPPYQQGMPPQQQQQQQQQQGPPVTHLQSQNIPNLPGQTFHVVEEAINLPASSSDSDIMHSIADFISNGDENGRQGDGSGSSSIPDFDSRPQLSSNEIWPLSAPDLAKIVHLDVKCEKNLMKVSVEFDRPYLGMIFSKGHFSSTHCIHLAAGSGRTHAYFDIRMDQCGTTGNMGGNGLVPAGGSAAGNFFENTVIFQYDPFVQEAWDQARKLRCTWHDQYEKSVSFRPFPVDMVDVVRADFAGDNVGCWMQIQVGRGPWASEVAGIVKIGQTMTMVLAIKDEENKFDMLVRNCVAHDGKRAPIELVDTHGCIVRSKLMSRFTKIKNFGSSASVLSYAHFQAFKFPDSMEVHFQCTIQICKHRCPEQCDTSGISSNNNGQYSTHQISGTFNPSGNNNNNNNNMQNHQMGGISGLPDSLYMDGPLGGSGEPGNQGPMASALARPREIRSVKASEFVEEPVGKVEEVNATTTSIAASKEVGVNKVIRVVSSGDLSFVADKLTSAQPSSSSEQSNSSTISTSSSGIDQAKSWLSERMSERICMSSLNFILCFAILVILLLFSCLTSVVLCCRRRSASSLDGSHSGHHHHSKCKNGDSKLKKSAKETLMAREYSGNGGGVLVGAGGYLGSSSVLSPRVQASNYQQQQQQQAHHRSSDLYHS